MSSHFFHTQHYLGSWLEFPRYVFQWILDKLLICFLEVKHKQSGFSLTEENYDYTTQSTDALCAQKNESNFILVRTTQQHCLNKLPSISTTEHQQMSRTFHVSQLMLLSSKNSKEKCFSASPSYIKRLPPVKLLRVSKPRNHFSSCQPMPEPSKGSLNIKSSGIKEKDFLQSPVKIWKCEI